jgi:predicted AAA+ superfamily ATPase
MDPRFLPHNTHREEPGAFIQLDPHLRQLNKLPLVHRSDLISRLSKLDTGIYTIGGGRQVGKTTLLKQWMAKLITDAVDPEAIAFVTGELIDDHHSLVRLVNEVLNEMPDEHLKYLIVDEVTYIKDWDKAVKYLADAGLLENVVLMLTGSDLSIIREARMRFPGRRGPSGTVDFHLYPLSFCEFVKLKSSFTPDEFSHFDEESKADPSSDLMDRLFIEFENYLIHGGFLTAINDLAQHQQILPATLATYSDWIRGDVLKRNKRENYLLEILAAIINRYGSQLTWNALAGDLSIDHPKTVADYIELLVSMDAVFVQPAIREDKLTAAPKKAKKVVFTDPFIFHAVNFWLNPIDDPFTRQLKPVLADRQWSAKLTEACVVTHYRRRFPTFYIKSKGEVDVAYVSENRFWPVEIKWTRQLRPKQLKQIAVYPNGRILTQSKVKGEIQGLPTEPLPLALLKLGRLQ